MRGIGSFTLLATLFHVQASPLRIISDGTHYIKELGDNIAMDCAVAGTGYNSFFNPVVWYKVLEDQDVRINDMAAIEQKFRSTGRYEISPNMQQTEELQVNLVLNLTGLTLAENGTYRCDLKSKESEVLSSVTYSILIPGDIEELELFTNKSTSTANGSEVVYEFRELEPAYLGCRSKGGNPKPQVKIYREKTDITAEFTTEERLTAQGDPGLQVMSYDINVYNPEFRADVEERGERLKCVARIHKLPNRKKMVSGTMEIKYPPKFQCSAARTVTLPVDDFLLDCRIQGNPRVSVDSVTWRVPDVNGTTNLTVGNSVNGYTANATVDEEDGSIDIRLFIKEVNQSALITYRVSARNDLGEEHFEIAVYEATTTTSTTTPKPVVNEKEEGNDAGKTDGSTSGGEIPAHPRTLISALLASVWLLYQCV